MGNAEKALEEIKEVLKRNNAYITVDDHFAGYSGCGQDLRITINTDDSCDEVQVRYIDVDTVPLKTI